MRSRTRNMRTEKVDLGRYVNSRTSKRSMEKRRWQRIMGKRRQT